MTTRLSFPALSPDQLVAFADNEYARFLPVLPSASRPQYCAVARYPRMEQRSLLSYPDASVRPSTNTSSKMRTQTALTRHKRRPSACVRCRRRKVRCDGAVPACSNCAKAGVDCLEGRAASAVSRRWLSSLVLCYLLISIDLLVDYTIWNGGFESWKDWRHRPCATILIMLRVPTIA